MAYLQNITKYDDVKNLGKNIIDDVITSVKVFIFAIRDPKLWGERVPYTHVLSDDIIQSNSYINFKTSVTIPKTDTPESIPVDAMKDWINTKDLQLSYKIYKGIDGYYRISVSNILYSISISRSGAMSYNVLKPREYEPKSDIRLNITLSVVKVPNYECYFDILNVDIMTLILKHSPVISILSLTQDYLIPDVNFEILYKENFSEMYNNIFKINVAGGVFQQSTKDLLKLDRAISWKDHYIQILRTYSLWHNEHFLGFEPVLNIEKSVEDYIRRYSPSHRYHPNDINRMMKYMYKSAVDMSVEDFIINTIIDMSMMNLDAYFTPQDVSIKWIPELKNNSYRAQFIRQLKLYDYMFIIIVNSEFDIIYINMFIYYIWQYSKIYFNYIIDHADPNKEILTENSLLDPDLGFSVFGSSISRPSKKTNITPKNMPMILDISIQHKNLIPTLYSKLVDIRT